MDRRTNLIAALAGVALAAVAAPAAADTLRVPKDHATIQAAVDAAGNDEVIQIGKGTYNERVVVAGKTGLTIQGKGKVIIDGGGIGTALAVTDSARVTLQKLRFTNGADRTLNLVRSTDCVVTKCRVEGAPNRALVVSAGGGHTITKNRFAGNTGANIDLDSDANVNPTDCVVTKNKVSGGFVGVELQGTGHLVERNNVKTTTGFGIQTFQGDDILIQNNKLTKVQGVGVRLRAPNARAISNKIVKCTGDGVYVSASATGARVEKNTIKKPGSDGINTDNPVDDLTALGNKVIGAGDDGLDLSVTNSTIQDNKVIKSGDDGLRLDGASANSVFSGNSTKKSGGAGLLDFAGDQAGNTFTDNRFDSTQTP